jgi:hypothetical protein
MHHLGVNDPLLQNPRFPILLLLSKNGSLALNNCPIAMHELLESAVRRPKVCKCYSSPSVCECLSAAVTLSTELEFLKIYSKGSDMLRRL